jgi:subtilisin family serine protease
MASDIRTWRAKLAIALPAAALTTVCISASPADAQSIMRTPNLRVESRVPTVSSNLGPRVNSSIGATAVARTPSPRVSLTPRMHAVPRIGVQSTLPNARYSPNLSPACDYAYRGSDGECSDSPVVSGDGGGKKGRSAKKGNGGARDSATQIAVNQQAAPNELVAEIEGALTDTQVEQLARRHGLTRLEARNFPLLDATIGLFRITDRRSADVVRRELAADGSVRSVQLNLRYVLQDQKITPTEGDPAQYALAQLRLPQAHALARGMNVTIAVIDSGIDANHPELANAIADSFDALGSKEGPHVHGTGIAGAIAAHARLMGSAPEVRILAIRAFGAAAGGAQSTSYVILKGLDYAALNGAQIINMSFAGPKDSLIERAVAATAAHGIVLIAAAGNAGAKSPPLYPAANPNVIAVSGTDAQEKLFPASNRGNHIALAAPGADIFLPAPDGKYQMTSGTSFSAAYVSGIAALLLERNPALKPDDVRTILTSTARDLGAPGRDDLFGAGEADAFAAVTAVASSQGTPVAAAKDASVQEKSVEHDNASVSRVLSDPAQSIASDKSTAN